MNEGMNERGKSMTDITKSKFKRWDLDLVKPKVQQERN